MGSSLVRALQGPTLSYAVADTNGFIAKGKDVIYARFVGIAAKHDSDAPNLWATPRLVNTGAHFRRFSASFAALFVDHERKLRLL
jgi:hypothetical protein